MMIKGAQKQMIVIRTGESRYFDEAYFVLRRDVTPDPKLRNDMLLEANRILRERAVPNTGGRWRAFRRWTLFLGGGICGAGIAVLAFLLL